MSDSKDERKYMTTKTASLVYDLTPRKLRTMIHKGELTEIKIHRDKFIIVAELDKLFRDGTTSHQTK